MISSAFANDLLKLVFNGASVAGLADNAATTPLTGLYLSLHTADPGAAGDQSSSEVDYTGYARLAVSRDGTGFTVTDNAVSPTSTMEFGEMTAGTPQTATHMCLGTAATGAGKVLFRFTLAPYVALDVNITPRLRNTTTLTVVTS